jgi:hypothetical protein
VLEREGGQQQGDQFGRKKQRVVVRHLEP